MNDQNATPNAAPKLAAGNYDMICTGEVQYEDGENGAKVGIELSINGTLATAILYFTPNAKPFSIPKLKACGWSGSGDIASQIKGKTVKGRVKYETYEDRKTGEQKTSMKVDIFDGGGGIVFQKPMSDSQKSNFLSALAADVAATPAAGAGGPDPWDQPKAAAPNGPSPKAAGSFSLGNKG